MPRALAVVTACLVVVLRLRAAGADVVENDVRKMSNDSYKVRLSAALALSKSKDARAVIALADAIAHDDEPTIRRVSALALEKMIDGRTAEDARSLAVDALQKAARGDADEKVRETAAAALKAIGVTGRTPAATTSGHGGKVFVNIDRATDQSKHAPSDAADRLTRVVKTNVEKTGYSTSWPGGLPTSSELSSARARGFIVASTVKKIEITRGGHQAQIACTVQIRVAPWSGRDGGEKWEANKAAQAQGSARATTANSDRDITGGVHDCLEAVAEDVTNRQVVPFLRRLATGS
jgi:hypothetical protein